MNTDVPTHSRYVVFKETTLLLTLFNAFFLYMEKKTHFNVLFQSFFCFESSKNYHVRCKFAGESPLAADDDVLVVCDGEVSAPIADTL